MHSKLWHVGSSSPAGIELEPPALGVCSLSHWGEVPIELFRLSSAGPSDPQKFPKVVFPILWPPNIPGRERGLWAPLRVWHLL